MFRFKVSYSKLDDFIWNLEQETLNFLQLMPHFIFWNKTIYMGIMLIYQLVEVVTSYKIDI
jgi:hypothetical protein